MLLLARGYTAAPSGLYVRLCHAFVVLKSVSERHRVSLPILPKKFVAMAMSLVESEKKRTRSIKIAQILFRLVKKRENRSSRS